MSKTSPMSHSPLARPSESASRRDATGSSEQSWSDRSAAGNALSAVGGRAPPEAIDPRALSPSDVLALHRTHGNAHVGRWLEERAPQAVADRQRPSFAVDSVAPTPPRVQRDPLDEEVKKLLAAGKQATAEADKKDVAARTSGLKGKAANDAALDAAKADAAAAKHYVAALHKLAAVRERAQVSLGTTRGGRDVNAHFFKGATSEVALVIAGVHGSELSGVEVAQTLIKRLSAKGAPKPFFSVVIVPELFPDNVEAKRAWEQSQKAAWDKIEKDAAKQLKAYQTARKTARDPGRFTDDRRHGAAPEPNRQFPELGKPFDPANPVDSKGRPIERENIMLLTLLDRFKPVRVATLHAIKNPAEAGIYADPHPSLKGISAAQKKLADEAHKLSKLMAEAAKKQGAQVPGNWRGGKFSSLYPGQDPKLSADQIKRENKLGRSFGQWGPSQGPLVLTIEVNEQYASDSPLAPPGRKKELDAHAAALQEIFLGSSLAAFVVEHVVEPTLERLRQLRRMLFDLTGGQPAGTSGAPAGGQGVQRQGAGAADVRQRVERETDPNGDRAVLARQPSPASDTSKHYTLQAGVTLSADVEKKVGEIATAYHTARAKDIVVTSGTRTAASQAAAMYDKLEAGDDIVKLYKNKKAAREIKQAYDTAKAAKKARAEIVDAIKQALDKQIAAGTYISKHLRAGAVDVRSRDMSAADKKAFRTAAKGKATKVILETKPPHWHLQF